MIPLPAVTLSTTITPPQPTETLSGDAFQALIAILPIPVSGASVPTAAPTKLTATEAPDLTPPEQGARTMLALFDEKWETPEKPYVEVSDSPALATAYELLATLAPPTAVVAVPPSLAIPAPATPTAIKRDAAAIAASAAPQAAAVAVPQLVAAPAPATPTAIKRDAAAIAASAAPQAAAIAVPQLVAAPALATPTANKRGPTAATSAAAPALAVTVPLATAVPVPAAPVANNTRGAVQAPASIATPPATETAESAVDSLNINGLPLPPAPIPTTPVSSTIFVDPGVAAQPTFAERQLDLASDTQWLDQLANDIVSTARTDQRLSFRLLPPNLGKLDVDLEQSDAGMSVRLGTHSQEARNIIAAAQPQLVSELRAQGIRIAETDVHMSDSGQRDQNGQHGRSHADQSARPVIEVSIPTTESGDAPDLKLPAGRFA